MAQHHDNFYRSRQRSRRPDPQGDAIVIALTVQIIICIMLLLAATIVKKVDEAGYSGFRRQYDIMTTDQSQNGKLAAVVEGLTDGADGFFSTVENAVNNILSAITGGKFGAPDALEESAAESQPESQAEDVPAQRFNYSYLEPVPPDEGEQEATDGAEPVPSDQNSQGGMGGMEPVDVDATKRLTAPMGSSLAPVALAGIVKPPITGIITSGFAYRVHPLTQKTDFHTGMDIAAEEGRAILAALPGEVVEVGESEVYGNYIILQHATNLQTFYAHCSVIIATEGMAVRQGERIAKVGSTGAVTGPHLHFSVIVDETFTDPTYILGDNIQVVE